MTSLYQCGRAGYNAAREVIAEKRALQKKWELVALMGMVRRLRPAVVMEIGTYQGGTLLCWSRVCTPTTEFISVDLPGGPFGGGYTEQQQEEFQRILQPNQRLRCFRQDSHSPETFGEVSTALGARKIDFLFIDGDHSYEGVKADFEMYSPLVRRGGIVALHDIVPHPVHVSCQVHELWDKLKVKSRWKELVDERTWGGIGVIVKD